MKNDSGTTASPFGGSRSPSSPGTANDRDGHINFKLVKIFNK